MTQTHTPYSPTRKKIEWVFFILTFTFLCVLGTWQVQRLAWKESLIAQLEEARAAVPLPMAELPNDAESYAPLRFRFAEVTGTFLNEHELHMAARYHKGQLGYHLFTPLKMTDGRLLMVNRGWVPTFVKEQKTRPETLAQGEQTLKVMIRTQTDRNKFTPINQPEDNIWFGRDVDEMEAATGLDLLPVTVDVVETESNPSTMDTNTGCQALAKIPDGERCVDSLPERSRGGLQQRITPRYPAPSAGEIKLRNDHLSYAVTWFGIAFFWAIMFRVWRKRHT